MSNQEEQHVSRCCTLNQPHEIRTCTRNVCFPGSRVDIYISLLPALAIQRYVIFPMLTMEALLEIMTTLPKAHRHTEHLLVTRSGHFLVDTLPTTLRPLMQLIHGGYSRGALVVRFGYLCAEIQYRSHDLLQAVGPHLDRCRRTGVWPSSVDCHLYHGRQLLAGSIDLQHIIETCLCTYRSDPGVVHELQCTQRRLTRIIRSLTGHLHLEISV